MNFDCIWALSFLQLEKKYWRSLFKINFTLVNSEAGNEKRAKFWSGLGAEH